eukprot:scaffold11066_cov62-Phaeocystis_antarctica.AAC.1
MSCRLDNTSIARSARAAHILAHQLIGKPHGQHSPPGRPLLLMITPRHHCTRMHTALALSHESEWPHPS